MAFVPSYTVSQRQLTPNVLRFVDTSTGSDDFVNVRHIYLRKSNGEYLVPEGATTNYIEWMLGSNTIDIDVLDKDYALHIEVKWVSDPNIYPYIFDNTFSNIFN
jgi:hypothetical protein